MIRAESWMPFFKRQNYKSRPGRNWPAALRTLIDSHHLVTDARDHPYSPLQVKPLLF